MQEGLDDELWTRVCMTLVDQMGFGVAVLDHDMKLLRANEHAAAILAQLAAGEPPHVGRRLAEPVKSLLRSTIETQIQQPTTPAKLDTPDGESAVFMICTRTPDKPQSSIALGLCVSRSRLRGKRQLERLAERYALTLRERQVIDLLRHGLTNRDIAARLGLTESTVKSYLHRLYTALGVRSRTELLALLDRVRADS